MDIPRLSLSRTGEDLLARLDEGAALSEVLETLIREIEAGSRGGMLGSILLLDEAGERLLHGAAPSLPEAYCRAIDGIRIGPNVGSCGTAAYLGHAVYVTDVSVFAEMNEAYASYFPSDPPARTTIGVAALPMGAEVEMDAIIAV